MGLIFWLSSRSTLPEPDLFSNQDKLEHMAAYGILTWLLAGAFANWRTGSHSFLRMVLVTLFAIFYGISDEWHQSFVPGRDASSWDVLADGMGALIVSCTLFRWPFLLPRLCFQSNFRFSSQRAQRE